MGDYKRPYPPRPMTNPCLYCGRSCANADNYKCDLFRIMYIIEWEQTVAFLREKMALKKENDKNEIYQSNA